MRSVAQERTFTSYLGESYFAALDGLRAVSVLLVVTAHMGERQWSWLAGELGVVVFFVLSGFLITTLALREERERGRLHLGAFMVRRTFRIFPLFYLVLAIYCLWYFVGPGNPDSRAGLARALPWYVTYMQEVPFFFGTLTHLPYYQTWSLGIEEKFYLVWPLVGFIVMRKFAIGRAVATVALCVAFVVGPELVPNAALARCLRPYAAILIGCLIAQVLNSPAGFARLRLLSTELAVTISLVLALITHVLLAHFAYPVPGAWSQTVYAVAISPLLVGMVIGGNWPSRILSLRPLCYVGRVSYGIYLIHILVIIVVRRFVATSAKLDARAVGAYLVVCGVSILAAWLLAVVVERPITAAGRRWAKQILQRSDQAATRDKAVSQVL